MSRSPIAHEVIIPDHLFVDVYLHSLTSQEGPVSCWTYVSRGLWPLGQKEVVFTVKRRAAEAESAYPRDLLNFYSMLDELASNKRFVDVGSVTSLGPGGASLLGRRDFVGLLYAPPLPREGVHIAAPSLTALVLTAHELALGREYGVVRVMTTLGKANRFFPTTPWADRDRRELVSSGDLGKSLLSRMRRMAVLDASVRQEGVSVSRTEVEGTSGPNDQLVKVVGSRVVLRLRPGAAATLKDMVAHVPADQPVALLVGPDPGAAACLAWQPGQVEPTGIAKRGALGAQIAGNFITFLPGQVEEGGRRVEDGFVIFLHDETWHRLRGTLESGTAFSLPATGARMGLEVVWAPEVELDFADPVESQRPGGWEPFDAGPPVSRDPSRPPAFVKSIALLTDPDVWGMRVETLSFSQYFKALEAVAISRVEALPASPGTDLALECEVRPDGTRSFRMSFRPEHSDNWHEDLKQRLMLIVPPPVVLGRIRFQLNVVLWGGSLGSRSE